MAVFWVKKDSLGNYKITDNVEYLILDKIKLDNLYDNRGAFEAWLSTPENIDNPAGVFLNGNKEFIPISIGGGGYAAPLYFTTINSIVDGYRQLNYSYQETEYIIESALPQGETLLQSYIYDGNIDISSIPAGTWVSSFYSKVAYTAGTTLLRLKIYNRDINNVETLLFSTDSTSINNTNDFAYFRFQVTEPVFPVNTTDRLVIKLYGYCSLSINQTIYTKVGGINSAYVTTPLQIRHNSLRDFNGDPNYQHITISEKALLHNRNTDSQIVSPDGNTIVLSADNNGILHVPNRISINDNSDNSNFGFGYGNGFDPLNDTYYENDVFKIDSFIESPFVSAGYSINYLLYTEDFNHGIWVKTNIGDITANSAIAPNTMRTAENIPAGTTSSANIKQTITNSTISTWTFGVWLRTQSGIATISLRIDSSSETGISKDITLDTKWRFFSVSQVFTLTHTTKTVYIISGTTAISAWGARFNPGNCCNAYYRNASNEPSSRTGIFFNTTIVLSNLSPSTLVLTDSDKKLTSSTGTDSQLISAKGTPISIGDNLTLADGVLTASVGGSSFWTDITVTYISATSFSVPDDMSNIFVKGVVIKWTDDVGVLKLGMITSSSYSTVTTINIIGSTIISTDINFKYGPLAYTETFIIVGTFPTSATTDVSKSMYLSFDSYVLSSDLFLKVAGSGSGSTIVDINANGTSMFSTRPTINSTNTSDIDNVSTSPTTIISAGAVITIDADTSTSTPGTDAYIILYYMPKYIIYR